MMQHVFRQTHTPFFYKQVLVYVRQCSGLRHIALWVTTLSPLLTLRQCSLCTSITHQPASLKAEYFASSEWENIMFLLSGLCGLHYVDTEIGQLHHYRRDCYQDPCPLAKSVVRDDRVWAHLDTVIKNSNRAIKAIEFDFDESLSSNRK